jgi:hypothetical protein
MKNYYWGCLFFLFLFSISCQKNNKIIVRDFKGKTFEEFIQDKDTLYKINYSCYYENGILMEEGTLIHTFRDGLWKQNYKDGKPRWVGYYDEGHTIIPNIDSNIAVNIIVNKASKTKDGFYPVRVNIDALHPDDMIFVFSNAYVKRAFFDDCEIQIKPKSEKIIRFEIKVISDNSLKTIYSGILEPDKMIPIKSNGRLTKILAPVIDSIP